MGEFDLQGLEYIRRSLFPTKQERLERQARQAATQNQLLEQQKLQAWMSSDAGRKALEAGFNKPLNEAALLQAQAAENNARGNLYSAQADRVKPESEQNIAASKASVQQNSDRIFQDWLNSNYAQYQANANRAMQRQQFDASHDLDRSRLALDERRLTEGNELAKLQTAANLIQPLPASNYTLQGTGKNQTMVQAPNPQVQPVLNKLGLGGAQTAPQVDPERAAAAEALKTWMQNRGVSPQQYGPPAPTTAPSLPITAGSQFRPGGTPAPATSMPTDSWLNRAGRWLMNPPEWQDKSLQRKETKEKPKLSELIKPDTTEHARSAAYIPQNVDPQLMQFISQEVQQNPQLLQQLLIATLQGGV